MKNVMFQTSHDVPKNTIHMKTDSNKFTVSSVPMSVEIKRTLHNRASDTERIIILQKGKIRLNHETKLLTLK